MFFDIKTIVISIFTGLLVQKFSKNEGAIMIGILVALLVYIMLISIQDRYYEFKKSERNNDINKLQNDKQQITYNENLNNLYIVFSEIIPEIRDYPTKCIDILNSTASKQRNAYNAIRPYIDNEKLKILDQKWNDYYTAPECNGQPTFQKYIGGRRYPIVKDIIDKIKNILMAAGVKEELITHL